MTIKIAHIINPFAVKESSDLFIAQPITFETMKVAQDFARSSYNLDVALYSAQFLEDSSIVPKGFVKTRNLEYSVLDLKEFKIKRKLPLIKDILDRFYEKTDADYLIYTNVDIAVMPHFYVAIKNIINQGFDAFIINRRTISETYKSVEQIPLMYADLGTKHPGCDCFVFKRSAYKNYKFGSACIGANLIGKILATNLICNADNFIFLKDLHLTFHIGDDRSWRNTTLHDYTLHNLQEMNKIVAYYSKEKKLKKHPIIDDFFVKNNNGYYYYSEDYWKMKTKESQIEKIKLIVKKIKQRLFMIIK